MKYAEIYAHLKNKYNYDNFETIAKTIEQHFGDIFNLEVLNEEKNLNNIDSSYMQLFDLCMKKLKGLHTVGEVVGKLFETLQSPEVMDKLLKEFIFVPAHEQEPSKQLSLLEKLAVGGLKVAEPLTYLDMVRLAGGLNEMHTKHTKSLRKKVKVVQLNHLMASDELNKEDLKKSDALLINLNPNLNEIPKWGVVNLQEKKPSIYCESALTEREKSEVQKALGITFNDDQFLGATANSPTSTGHMAIAWLDQHVIKAWSFDTSTDFSALFKNIVLSYFGGDNPGKEFLIKEKEYSLYCSEAFQYIIDNLYNKDKSKTKFHFYGGSILTRASDISSLGKLDVESFDKNDLKQVLQIMYTKKWRRSDLDPYVYKVFRTLLPGFNHTLSELEYTVPDKDSIRLDVPHPLDVHTLYSVHRGACSPINANYGLFQNVWDEVPRVPGNPNADAKEEFYASMLILALVRSKAKKSVLSINLPKQYQLNKEEQDFVIKSLEENPYVTQFNINDNDSLKPIKESLISILARNRWLKESGYRPPFFDDYWLQAARYWLNHLPEVPDLLQPKNQHALFKGCVREMGLIGLRRVLALLNDPIEREHFENLYGKNRPAFYAACLPTQYVHYIRALEHHLSKGYYFPFRELGISFQPYTDDLVFFLQSLNSKQFERITFTDYLIDTETNAPRNLKILRDFFSTLMEEAHKNQWTSLIIIPELEDKSHIKSEIQELQSQYALLNDIIIKNRRQKSVLEEIKELEKASQFDLSKTVPSPLGKTLTQKQQADELKKDVKKNLKTLQDGEWPLKKGGVTQLQLQQQQQIEQTRQTQQEQEKKIDKTIEEAITSELVDYNNIDKLLTKFWNDFQTENLIKNNAATLKTPSESQLQGFFHTWINANPQKEAYYAIKKMTIEAAQALLRKHSRLSSGLNPENLPKGFYTQRSKDGYLILCYNPELCYVTTPNPLTLNLSINIPQPEAWQGDFRQIKLSKYIGKPIQNLDAKDWDNIILFAKMQPPRDFTQDVSEFFKNNQYIVKKLSLDTHRTLITEHWSIFLQTWHYAGIEGIKQFLSKNPNDFNYSDHQLRTLLFIKSKLDIHLATWAIKIPMDTAYLRALGQIYYNKDPKGIPLFVSKLKQLETVLGENFLAHLNKYLFAKTANLNCFMAPSFFTTMNEMMEQLSSHQAQGTLKVWEKILELHMTSLDWERIETLWQGFKYFNSEIGQLGIKLDGTEFDQIKPENMLVFMDRILNSLKQIPDHDQQKLFLKHLGDPKFDLDLTYGGVHYALQHEGFKYFNKDLNLKEFNSGSPTYAPDLTKLYHWTAEEARLQIKRTLASKGQFNQGSYKFLLKQLDSGDVASRNQLLWLLHTQSNSTDINNLWVELNTISPAFQDLIARHLFKAVYQLGNKQLNISFEALVHYAHGTEAAQLPALLLKYPEGTALEALSILYLAKRATPIETPKLFALLNAPVTIPAGYPNILLRESYKLAALFGITDPHQLEAFYQATEKLRPIVYNELKLLINQLLSIEYNSDVAKLTDPVNWQAFLDCIEQMKNNMVDTSSPRLALIDNFSKQNIRFKYTKSGDFRAINETPLDKPQDVSFFVEHETRLWKFMKEHILVPVKDENAQVALIPILRFLKRLQLSRTYLNEIEPLLASLEETAKEHYWSAPYFLQILRALQPENEQSQFPISLLKIMLKEEFIAPKTLDRIEKDFPEVLNRALKNILNSPVFDREQQELLCQIALHECSWQGQTTLLNNIMALLAPEGYAKSRSYALEILAKSKSFPELESRFENCRWLIQYTPAVDIESKWTRVSALWLKALSTRKQEEDLFHKIKNQFPADADKEKLSFILHILAFSTLDKGLKENEDYQHDLDKKALKLVGYLSAMSPADLLHLAKAYPGQPSPTAEDIIRLIRKQQKEKITWPQSFETFTRRPFTEPRADYGFVSSTRDVDLQRMIAETKISADQPRESLHVQIKAQLTLIFSYLKQFEAGTLTLPGSKQPISQMNPQELADAFHQLSHSDQTDLVRAQVWAVLFEVLGRTTRKYPHLAQQFALIANDIGVHAPKRVIQLATGEGKSHFVAMRAARHAALGKIVDVCTAKRTLAERDLEDYKSFFDYLNIKTVAIHARSSYEDYEKATIHYSTLGDLSLFLDEQSYAGHPINVAKEKRVAIFDEFDFIRFDEGRKTEYNYARPTGKTPKQMTWFYQSINDFYKSEILPNKNLENINQKLLKKFTDALLNDAGENEERQLFIASLMQDPLQLVQWLQSAYETFSLQEDIDFTVREENIEVGNESYPMREIIPLSRDNQKMAGSTFSAGVHQLLAVRLNNEARDQDKPQNFHIHPESNIISSQVAEHLMNTLWSSWEGFTGTISAAQAKMLNKEEQAKVLHVPTNQRDLRFWHAPKFYKLQDETKPAEKQPDPREQDLIAQIKTCLNKKQSMLFSCKNDQQVKWLKELLTKSNQFSKEELTQYFIFYTNADKETPAEVLKCKETKEGWQGGKKQRAVGLVASGFGRGDNVGIEAVFLLDVNDTNDKLQKGGRTARNGAEGEVFQYYLSSNLNKEEARLLDEIAILEPTQFKALKKELTHVENLVAGKDEQCFERVMLLREYLFNLQNAANQGYHKAIAYYSSWGMQSLGAIEDLETRQELTNLFSVYLRQLDKVWIDISSKPMTPNEKINLIETQISSLASNFLEVLKNKNIKPSTGFNLPKHPPINIQLVVDKKASKPTETDRAIASICSAISRLSGLTLQNQELANIPKQLTQLETNPVKLKQFAAEITGCTSISEFTNKMNLVMNKSKVLEGIEQEYIKPIQATDLFHHLSDESRTRCMKALNNLPSDLQEQIINSLTGPSLLSIPGRVQKALPLIEYLSKFSRKHQEQWGADYIAQMQTLFHLMDEKLLSLCLSQDKPMSVAHFIAFAKLIQSIDANTLEETENLYKQLIQATEAEPEQRVRMLTKWESWSKYVPNSQKKSFLMDFCQVMAHFKEGKNWDVFLNLVKKTQNWINKGGEASYTQDLLNVWHKLAQHSANLPQMSKHLQWAMTLSGKSWFQSIPSLINLPSEAAFSAHKARFDTLLNSETIKKQKKSEEFNRWCHQISNFHEAIGYYDSPKQHELEAKFVHLDPKQFDLMIQFIAQLGDLAISKPIALEMMLEYLNLGVTDNVTGLKLIQILLNLTQYHAKNPNFNYEQSAKALLTFKDYPPEILDLLLQAMDYHEGSIHNVQHLINGSMNFLAQLTAPQVGIPQILKELDAERFKWVLESIQKLEKVPHTLKAFENMLYFLTDKDINLECNDILFEITIQICKHLKNYPSIKCDDFFSVLAEFKYSSIHTLKLLQKAVDYYEEKIHGTVFDELYFDRLNFKDFAETFAHFNPAKQSKLTQQLEPLDIERFTVMTQFIVRSSSIDNPEAIPTMLSYLNDSKISVEHSLLFSELILALTQYQSKNTHFDYKELTGSIALFKDKNPETLILLLKAMNFQTANAATETGTIQTVAPLLNNQFYNNINLFYQAIAPLDTGKQNEFTQKLTALNTEHLQLMMEFTGNLDKQSSHTLKALESMLSILGDNSIDLNCKAVLSEIFLQITHYQTTNPDLDYNALITHVRNLKNLNLSRLTLLFKFMDYREGSIHTVEPLRNLNIEFLNKLIDQFEVNKQSEQIQKIEQFNASELDLLFNFLGTAQKLKIDSSQNLEELIQYLSDKQISLESKTLLTDLFLKIVKYQKANVHINYGLFMQALSKYKYSNLETLQLLLTSFETAQKLDVNPLAILEESAQYLNDEQISPQCKTLFAEILIQITKYQKANTHISYVQLLQALSQYKHADVNTLQLLLKSMEYHNGAIQNVNHLLDHSFDLLNTALTKFDETKQSELRTQIQTLNPKQFNLIVNFTQDLDSRLLEKRPRALETMLSFVTDPNIPIQHSNIFSDVIRKLTEYEDENPQVNHEDLMKAIVLFKNSDENTLNMLMEAMDIYAGKIHTVDPLLNNQFHKEITLFYQAIAKFDEVKQERLIQIMTKLPNERLQIINTFTKNLGEQALQQPEALEEMLSYLEDPDISADANLALSKLILQLTQYQAKNPHSNYALLMDAVHRFKPSEDCNEYTLKFLSKTMNAMNNIELLFDNVVFYIDKKVPAETTNSVTQVVGLFYKTAKEEMGNSLAISSRPEISKFFDFDHDTKKNQNQRLTWMHLMQKQVFVKYKNLPEYHDYIWTHKRNEELLQLGLNHYLQHTKKILAEEQDKPNIHKKRGLTEKQQYELLKLADELSIIGKSSIPSTSLEVTRDKTRKLSSDLTQLMHTYQGSWFKHKSRKIELKQLNVHLSELTQKDAPNYLEIVKLLGDAKLHAIENDEKLNQDRWFKMNRSGQSRYFNTLNQMQDLVLRRWSLDPQELHTFKKFKAHSQGEFIQLVQSLEKASAKYFNECYPTPQSKRHKELKQKLSRFFNSTKEQTHLQTLNTALLTFSTEAKKEPLTADMVKQLMDKLHKEVTVLPGHLLTLANEILIRGNALGLNLSEQADVDEMKANIGKK
jgi:hypothetical protein